ncbi:hypothetical protein CWR41_01340 [Cedecea lapagei]|jgi:type 1 fimbria pilin|nr:hypothetical protein CWR41_01340 [Cedecea lapagei]
MRNFFLALQLPLLLSCSLSAYAADQVVINYSGYVVIPACEVITSKVDIIFHDEIGAQSLATSGTSTAWNGGYTIQLTGCEAGAKINMKMEGQAAANDKYYKNQADAKHIVVELASDDDRETVYSNASSHDFQLPAGVDYLSIPLKARLLNSGDGEAEPGLVKSVITATFSYN